MKTGCNILPKVDMQVSRKIKLPLNYILDRTKLDVVTVMKTKIYPKPINMGTTDYGVIESFRIAQALTVLFVD